MDTREQVEIMKAETRLANRADAEGLRNWTDEARAKSLAIRRARGSVWGWDKRKRPSWESAATTDAAKRSWDALAEDAEEIKKTRAIHDAGGYTLEAPDKQAEQFAKQLEEQRLEAFREWLSEVKRVEGAIDNFNEIVAVMGGMTSGIAKAQKGQVIGQGYGSSEAEAAARKAAAFEKSFRRNFEKRNADHLRKYPEDRAVMMDMVAEKAEYYSAQPAQKVEIEKDAYRRIKDNGAMNLREQPKTQGADYRILLEQKRQLVREREAVRPQLQPDEVAYPAGNGIWIGKLPNGDERVISAFPETEGLYNRHTDACAASKGEACTCSCGGSLHGGGSGVGEPEVGTPVESASGLAHDSKEENGVKGMAEEERLTLIDELERKSEQGKTLDASETQMLKELKEASAEWTKMMEGFRQMITDKVRPSLETLVAQLKKDKNTPKYRMAVDALSEAYHTKSLDLFQDKYGRDPKGNKEFQDFQRIIKIPNEFIGE